MAKNDFFTAPKPRFTHCRVCKCKLNAMASRMLGLCRVCAVKTQEAPKR